MSNKPKSKRHHFIPKFFLNQWKDKNGKLWIYQQNNDGGISYREGNPTSVAYVKNLYTLKSEHPARGGASDIIERTFMGEIDDQSSIIHKKLVCSGVDVLTANEKTIFSKFISSLIERTPKKLDIYKKASPIEDYLENLKSVNPSIFEAIERNNIDIEAIRDNVTLSFMMERIIDPEFIDSINQMEWIIVEHAIDDEHFILGDDALIVDNGEDTNHEPSYIRIAISPSRLLILVAKSLDVDDDFIALLVFTYNPIVIRSSKRYIISSKKLSDATHTKFNKALKELHTAG